MRRTLSIIFLILGFCTATFAQSDEFSPLPTVTVEKKVNLRRGPSTTRLASQTLNPRHRTSSSRPKSQRWILSRHFWQRSPGLGLVEKHFTHPLTRFRQDSRYAPNAPCADSFASVPARRMWSAWFGPGTSLIQPSDACRQKRLRGR